MTRLRRVPPGRAGKLWLRRRLGVAQRGADLLDHKLRILHAERQRLVLLIARTAAAWDTASREADGWLLRGALLGGQRAVRLAQDGQLADVEITWAQSMGVRYPARATCALPEPGLSTRLPSNAALDAAREAYRRAVEAAIEHAVAEAAFRVVEMEEAATRRRLRAIEDRWVPRLQQALAEVQLGLEEQEHAEGVRLRWAVARGQGPGRSGLAEGDK